MEIKFNVKDRVTYKGFSIDRLHDKSGHVAAVFRFGAVRVDFDEGSTYVVDQNELVSASNRWKLSPEAQAECDAIEAGSERK